MSYIAGAVEAGDNAVWWEGRLPPCSMGIDLFIYNAAAFIDGWSARRTAGAFEDLCFAFFTVRRRACLG